MTGRIGILAYGSLIVDPGNEIGSLTIRRLNCVTPFSVEYARLSKKRDYAPTLIPVAIGGCPVNAVILLLKPETSLEVAKDILWRRETRQDDLSRRYPEHKPPGKDSVRIEVIHNLAGVETVIYTSISRNISVDTPAFLADQAIQSILKPAGEKELDGVRYLLNAKNSGIVTPMTLPYEAEILKRAGAKTLESAIKILDTRRLASREL